MSEPTRPPQSPELSDEELDTVSGGRLPAHTVKPIADPVILPIIDPIVCPVPLDDLTVL